MGSFLSGPKLPPPPTRSDEEVQAAAEKERLRRAGDIGRGATILTSPVGVQDSNVGSKKLLGN